MRGWLSLTTNLSKFTGLFVIARNSAFAYKGRHVDIKQIGRELGVRYLLEGSARREVGRVRISAQLIDAVDGNHLWADSFDCDMSGLFTVQDEVTRKIAVTLVAHIDRSEFDRVLRKMPHTSAAYDHCLRGNAMMREVRQAPQSDTIAAARAHYEGATAIDPEYAPAFLGLAEAYYLSWYAHRQRMHAAAEPQTLLGRALVLAQKAVELDHASAEAHAKLGWILHWHYRRGESMAEYERALELNPNLSDGRYGYCLIHNGRTSEGIEYLQRAMRLDPFYLGFYEVYLGLGYYLSGRFDDALRMFRTATRRMPSMAPPHVGLAATAARLGLHDEAAEAVRAARRIEPDLTISERLQHIRFARHEDATELAEGLRRAGTSDYIHMFVSVPPHIASSDLMQRAKGRSSYKIQMEFPEIRKRYWGRRFWGRGYFCTTSGNVTDDIILQYIQSHSDKPTDASR
jgi:adenylate cyclase